LSCTVTAAVCLAIWGANLTDLRRRLARRRWYTRERWAKTWTPGALERVGTRSALVEALFTNAPHLTAFELEETLGRVVVRVREGEIWPSEAERVRWRVVPSHVVLEVRP